MDDYNNYAKMVRKVLKGKDIDWHGDGTYTRNIAGELHKKMLIGKPRV